MTKNQTIELLKNQMPSFYSLEQVIDIVNGIEETNFKISAEAIEGLVRRVKDQLQENVDNVPGSDVIDCDSAEFELNRNEIVLDSVELDTRSLFNYVEEGVKDVIEEWFTEVEEEAASPTE